MKTVLQDATSPSKTTTSPGITFMSYEEIFLQELLTKKCILTKQNAIAVQSSLQANDSVAPFEIPMDSCFFVDTLPVPHPTREQAWPELEFQAMYHDALLHLKKQTMFVFQGYAGNPSHPCFFEVICANIETYHFCKNIFCEIGSKPTKRKHGTEISIEDKLRTNNCFTIFFLPHFGKIKLPKCPSNKAPLENATSKEVTIFHLAMQTALIFNTTDHATIKKTLFTWLSVSLPALTDQNPPRAKMIPEAKAEEEEKEEKEKEASAIWGIPLHCAASIGKQQDIALFFGLNEWQGTLSKELLLRMMGRTLLADDNVIWDQEGLWNIEIGLYEKLDNLQGKTNLFTEGIQRNALLEHMLNTQQKGNLDDSMSISTSTSTSTSMSVAENMRVSYPYAHLTDFRMQDAKGNHPKNIFLFVIDTFNVLPPVAYLNREQSMRYFLLGLLASHAKPSALKASSEAEAVSAVDYAPPLLVKPALVEYSSLFAKLLATQGPQVYLVNTSLVNRSDCVQKAVQFCLQKQLSKNDWLDYPKLGDIHVPKDFPFLQKPCTQSWHRATQTKDFHKRWKLFANNCEDTLSLLK